MTTNQLPISRILDAIEYQGDKQKFVQDFYAVIFDAAFKAFAVEMPSDQQKKLISDFSEIKTQEEFDKVLSTKFEDEGFQKHFLEEYQKNLQEYLEAITPSLSDRARQRLVAEFQS